MSIARVTIVPKSRKAGKCERCGDELPIGSTYRWFKVGFRSNYKHTRCMKHTCAPRLSELESSGLSTVYSAQENLEDALADRVTLQASEIDSAWDEFKEQVREYADECRSALDSWEYGNEQLESRADAAESAADEAESYEVESWSGDEDLTEDDEEFENYREFINAQADAAIEAAQNLEFSS